MKKLSKKAKILLGAGAAIGVVLLARKAMASSSPDYVPTPGASPHAPSASPSAGQSPVPPMVVPDYPGSGGPNPFGETGSGGGTAGGQAASVVGYEPGGSGGLEVFTNE
jgi:hypothetical protein